MSRPELSLYRDRPLLRQHHALLIDASCVEDPTAAVEGRVATGIVLSGEQIGGHVFTKPILVRCDVGDFWDKDISFFKSWLQRFISNSVAGVVFEVYFGGDDELGYVGFMAKAIELLRKKRLESIVRVHWVDERIASEATASLAIRHGVRAKADYIVIEAKHDFSMQALLNSADGGELLIGVSEWDDQDTPVAIRRMIADGARGVVIPHSSDQELSMSRYEQLAEIVLGL